ncbi:MAG: winged helix-turn-helix transcriptional regulator [Clostridia bacterium]|nr:winged helix-turn-helix transcriptional regulator [Clostridia bacterium]
MRTRKTSSERVKKEPEEYMHINKKRRCISEAASCINPKFEDEKYIASRKFDDFYYSIYVKPAKPEVRDAMMFLNIAFQKRERLFEDVKGKAEARVYMRNATDRLLAYADEKIGFLRLFFTKSNNVFPLTGIVMYPEMWREEFPFELLLELIDSYDDERLFSMLLMFLHTKNKVNKDFVKGIMADRKIFVLYLDGASYEYSVKQDLLRMYDMTALSNKGNPSLKVLLKQFIQNFYRKYEEAYNYAIKAIEKELSEIEKEIRKNGELLGVTDYFVFRRLLMRGRMEKSICIEFSPFCKTNIEFFASYSGITICVGNCKRTTDDSMADSERVGEKLKLLGNERLYKIMKSIFAKPTSLAEIASDFGISMSNAYKILSKLVEERYIYKNEDNQKYIANKEHFMNVVHLFEKYGGENR